MESKIESSCSFRSTSEILRSRFSGAAVSANTGEAITAIRIDSFMSVSLTFYIYSGSGSICQQPSIEVPPATLIGIRGDASNEVQQVDTDEVRLETKGR